MSLNKALPAEVDVLVVGSGFGGSVMAAELARARKVKDGDPPKICLLERGQAFPPGSFPRDPAGVSRNFWAPNAGLYGMFNVRSFRHMDVVVSSGLGGGSLIYANVMLRKDKTWFTQPHPINNAVPERWMLTAADLEPHYQQVLEFLRVQELPHGADDPQEFRLAKTSRFLQNTLKAIIPKPLADNGTRDMNDEARAFYSMGLNEALTHFEGDAGYAPLAVRFRVDDDGPGAVGAPLPPEPYGNLHDDNVHRTTCTLIGECDVGCNQGAKNTLDHTYLSEASFNGASIHTLAEVTKLEYAEGDDYPFTVTVQRHELPETSYVVDTVEEWAPEYSPTSTQIPFLGGTAEIRARRVVLAAGTLGTTSLLLRNAGNLPVEESARVGSRFCGNGDFLAFVSDAEGRLDCTRGPVITAFRRYPAETDPAAPAGAPSPGGDIPHGMYIEDAGYPTFVAWLVQLAQLGKMGKTALEVWLQRRFNGRPNTGQPAPTSDMSQELSRILAGGEFSSKAMPLLGMGRDRPVGQLYLDGDDLQCEWTMELQESYYQAMEKRMQIIARGFKGKLLSNPLFDIFNRGITVHPVGGCPMDTTEEPGVIDSYGRVRGVPGLRVCDGSVFPGPIGPNPSLTIAAFASRSAQNLHEEGDWAHEAPEADVYNPPAWLAANP
jgi:cholesterol oxidase